MGTLKVNEAAPLTATHRAFGYQQEALDSLSELEFGGIFHEQGLGKTKIAIDLMLHWLRSGAVDSVIIVVKKGLLTNWKREIAVHTKLVPRVLSQNRNENFFAFNSPARLYLCHFEVVKAEKSRLELFLRTRKVGIIIDEAQKLKNPDSDLTQAFLELSSKFCRRVIMTGTPVANRPYDLWALIRFLDGGAALGADFKSFKRLHDLTPEQEHDPAARRQFEEALSDIHRKISSFTVRETKAGADISLPSKEIRYLTAPWETIQHEMYRAVRDDLRLVITRGDVAVEDDSEELVKRLLRLVQIASNPKIVDTSYSREPGKMEVLRLLLQDIVSNQEKAIVWTCFTDNADWLVSELREEWGTVKLHGKMSMPERDRSVKRFLEDPQIKFLVATPGAAKEGLTLTVANHVIFYDRSFSLDDYLQAQDRIHRISQTRTCFVYNILMEESIDEWVDVLLKEKELAAKLAAGDIDEEEYRSRMAYSMHSVLANILSPG